MESPDQSRPLVERLNSVIEEIEKRARQSIVTPYIAIKFMLAVGPDATFNDPETTPPTPIRVEDWLCGGPNHRRISVWQVTPHGVRTQPYRNLKELYVFEGAYGSFLNAMAESGLPLTHSLKASSSDGEIEGHKIQDILMHYQRTMPNRTEDFRFTEALLRYGQLHAAWKDAYGKDRSTLDLVRSTLRTKPSDSINVASMRLTVLAVAWNLYQQDKGSGGDAELWTQIEQHLQDSISDSRRDQLPDGSWPPSKYSELSATSQMLKWIVEATPPAELGDDWISRAVESQITRITDPKSPVTSPHEFLDTIHALRVYRDKRFGSPMKTEHP